jgi:hypothetical protein
MYKCSFLLVYIYYADKDNKIHSYQYEYLFLFVHIYILILISFEGLSTIYVHMFMYLNDMYLLRSKFNHLKYVKFDIYIYDFDVLIFYS